MSPAEIGDVLKRFQSLESMTWAAIEAGAGSHFVELGDLCKDAQDRLVAIGQDDAGSLFSLRISGRQRVWGIREGQTLRVLWWDPKHEVCSSTKKHT